MENTVSISKSSQIKNALTTTKITENSVMEERAINWLNEEKVSFLVKTKINVNGEWITVGDTEIIEFQNSEESLKLLKNNVPEPYLSAVLTIWGESQKELLVKNIDTEKI